MVPFTRPEPKWLQEQADFVTQLMRKKLGSSDVNLIQPLIVPEQLFEKDRIHLNDLGLSMLHAHLMSCCPNLKRPRSSVSRASVSEDMDVFDEPSTHTSTSSTNRKRPASPVTQSSKSTRVGSNEASLSSMSTDDGVNVTIQHNPSQDMLDVIRTTIHDTMSKFTKAQTHTNAEVSKTLQSHSAEFLLVNETADSAINQANQHILLITGLKGSVKKERKERVKQAHKAAKDFLEMVQPGKVDVMFSTFIPGPPPSQGNLPMLKIAFGCIGDAHHVKRKFNEFRADNPGKAGNIYITPEQTKATRVRAAIMIAMCKKRKVLDFVKNAKPTVTRFEVRPDICFRNTSSGKIERRVSFKEACDRFMSALSDDDLLIAKKIAGRAMADRLAVLFGIQGSTQNKS